MKSLKIKFYLMLFHSNSDRNIAFKELKVNWRQQNWNILIPKNKNF